MKSLSYIVFTNNCTNDNKKKITKATQTCTNSSEIFIHINCIHDNAILIRCPADLTFGLLQKRYSDSLGLKRI